MEVLDVDDVTVNEFIRRNQHRKGKKLHGNHWCQISIIVEERLGILFFISVARTPWQYDLGCVHVSITVLIWQKIHGALSANIYLSKVWIATLE